MTTYVDVIAQPEDQAWSVVTIREHYSGVVRMDVLNCKHQIVTRLQQTYGVLVNYWLNAEMR